MSRGIDRVEAWSRLALLLVFLIVAPPVTWCVAAAVGNAGLQQEAAERSDHHRVIARLLEDAPDPVSGVGIMASAVQVPALAEWTAPDGSSHQGIVRTAPGARAGSAEPIWTDGAGRPIAQPQSRDDTVASVAGAAFLVVLLIGGLTAGIGGMVHHRCQERRYQEWALDWQRVGPDWSRN